MEPVRLIRSKWVALPIDNIDTDQIIPASFLKVTTRGGLGRHLFHGWRYHEDGRPRPDFPLNRPGAREAQVLVAGDNFGCGSSREHAPWALRDFGFRAVVSTSFASIFRNNALKNGLLPVVVEPALHRRLLASAIGRGEQAGGRAGKPEPTGEVEIDLETRTLTLSDGTRAEFPIEAFARYCLLNGVDELEFLLGQEEAIAEYEKRAAAEERP
jgi:3-isopropylmalate/(R)-2-methylmalate dehydratase small subunit